MNLEDYANEIADTIRQIVLDNSKAQKIEIDHISVGIDQTFISYTAKGEKIVRRYKDDERITQS